MGVCDKERCIEERGFDKYSYPPSLFLCDLIVFFRRLTHFHEPRFCFDGIAGVSRVRPRLMEWNYICWADEISDS